MAQDAALNNIVPGAGLTGAYDDAGNHYDISCTITQYTDALAKAAAEASALIPIISTGTAAPVSTPSKIGDLYLDTVAAKVYCATGTSSSADWKILN
jgi:hypothetical protein